MILQIIFIINHINLAKTYHLGGFICEVEGGGGKGEKNVKGGARVKKVENH